MPWNGIALVTSDVVGVALVARLLSMRLHRVYKVFSAYVLFVLLSSTAVFIEASLRRGDYRITYLCIALGSWILTFWMVYALLGAILAKLPGILSFSRRVLFASFGLAVLLAVPLVRAEFTAAKSTYPVWSLESAVVLVSVVERFVTTTSLLALLAIQLFLLWFPVQLPRNLVLFVVGFVFNFVVETALLFIRACVPVRIASGVIDPLNLFLLSVCLAYFALVITPAGEFVSTQIGHQWRPAEQRRLMNRLEEMNLALLKSVRQ